MGKQIIVDIPENLIPATATVDDVKKAIENIVLGDKEKFKVSLIEVMLKDLDSVDHYLKMIYGLSLYEELEDTHGNSKV